MMMTIRRLLAVAAVSSLSGMAPLHALQFIRGDSNLDDRTDISDAVNMLGVLFLGEEDPGCPDARDTNDSGTTDISDAVYLLNHLFSGGPAPPAPYPECGCDTTEDGLAPCVASPPGCGGAFCGDPDCIDQAFVDAAIEKNVPPATCTAPDGAQFAVGDYRIIVCPSTSDAMCNGAPGCEILIERVTGTLDLDAQEIRGRVEGSITDMPLAVTNIAAGTTQDCSVDLTFGGDVVMPFIARETDGSLVLVELLAPAFDRDTVDVELTATGGAICTLLAGFQDVFLDDLITELEVAAAVLLADLNAELTGRPFCSTR